MKSVGFGMVVVCAGTALAFSVALATESGDSGSAVKSDRVERGQYLVRIGGCNDCHTDGYLQKEGAVTPDHWLTGSPLGWRGPWGTTYGPNLRLFMSGLTEDQWVQVARSIKSRPPMPWFTLRAMHEEDLRAVYEFVRSLQPVGDPAPAFVPPERTPQGPYVQFPAE